MKIKNRPSKGKKEARKAEREEEKNLDPERGGKFVKQYASERG